MALANGDVMFFPACCVAPQGPVVSGTRGCLCIVHKGMRDELAQKKGRKKKRSAFELATVLLSLGQPIKKESMLHQRLKGNIHSEQPITVSAKPHFIYSPTLQSHHFWNAPH